MLSKRLVGEPSCTLELSQVCSIGKLSLPVAPLSVSLLIAPLSRYAFHSSDDSPCDTRTLKSYVTTLYSLFLKTSGQTYQGVVGRTAL